MLDSSGLEVSRLGLTSAAVLISQPLLVNNKRLRSDKFIISGSLLKAASMVADAGAARSPIL